MKILFLCTGNSCRSQIAEGFGRALAPPGVEIFSAGTRPVGINPRAIATMDERGLDISNQLSNSLDAVPTDPDLVVTLCHHAAENCGEFPQGTDVRHWPIDDPADATGAEDEVAGAFRTVRDQIAGRIQQLFREPRFAAGDGGGAS